MEPDKNGMLKLPLSSSPEYHHNSLAAWMTPNTNYDQSLMRNLFAAIIEMGKEFGPEKSDRVKHWAQVLAQMEPLAVEGQDGSLMLSLDETIDHSTFHLSHLMAIHPLGTMNIEGPERDRRIIEASLKKMNDLGTRGWAGYCWSWMSCMNARCDNAEEALYQLEVFIDAFIVRNGFHQNGDMKDAGYSTSFGSGYRHFTLEGNFAASQAVHEMLLQSWGGIIRVFPAVSKKWADVPFADLRAEGGFVVSAERKGGRTISVMIEATGDSDLILRDPFNGAIPKWNLTGINKIDNDYHCRLKAGQKLKAKIYN